MGGSYAERGSASTDTFFLVATIFLVLVLVGVSIHAVYVDVESLYHERQSTFLAAAERQKRLVGLISDELKDVEAGPELLHAAGEFLAVLDSTSRGAQVRRTQQDSIAVGDIEMDGL